MVVSKPQDRAQHAAVAKIHTDGKTVTKLFGPFDSIHAAQEFAEFCAYPDNELEVRSLTKPHPVE